ncbi:hypothetical protein [Sorangium sp. So ce854]|uniref:hypothetical protein n=1 Tax=Sorangium sp. So ce854 TaxID=3133322 RepID=UPI003F634F1A
MQIATISHAARWLPWTALARPDRILSMHTPGRQLLVSALLLTLAACAVGTDDLQPGYEEQAGGGGSGGGRAGEGGAGGVDASASSSSRSSSVSSSSASSSGAGGAGGQGGEGGGGEGAGGDGGAVAECDYAAPNTCAGAENLGSVSGDEGADSLTATGTTSEWFKVYVVDDAQILFNTTESFRATLTSPPGMNFDLIVYEGMRGVDAPDCFASGVRAQGTPESFMTVWDDVGGAEDGTWFLLEVRHVEGTACGEDARWILEVKGNPNGDD